MDRAVLGVGEGAELKRGAVGSALEIGALSPDW